MIGALDGNENTHIPSVIKPHLFFSYCQEGFTFQSLVL
jgi:hypothetical protein